MTSPADILRAQIAELERLLVDLVDHDARDLVRARIAELRRQLEQPQP